MLMLCVDASTSHFGFAWFKNGKLIKVEGTHIPGKFDLDKLRLIYLGLNSLFSSDVEHVVFEQPAPIRFSSALTSINQTFGVLVGICLERKITVDWVHNRTVKSIMKITAKGKAGKAESMARARQMHTRFMNKIKTDHISDAILIGETYKIITNNPRIS